MTKMKKIIFTRKILDSFQCLPLLLKLFSSKPLDDFHDFVSECVSFARKINNPFWGVIVFSEEKSQFSLDVEQNTHFSDENRRKKKIAEVSPSNNNYSFRIKKPFNNNNQ